jgi:hypothetical protein
LGATEEIFACQNNRNGLFLNGSWSFIAFLGYGFEQGLNKAKFCE